MTIGDRIKKVRTDLGISQTELAKRTKTSKQTIFKYESNIVTNIPSDKVEEIARTLNISPGYLMGWEEIHNEITLSSDEKMVLIEYRKADDMTKEMVRRVLHIEGKNNAGKMA